MEPTESLPEPAPKVRGIKEIDQEYVNLCTLLGDKSALIVKFEAEIKDLHQQIMILRSESALLKTDAQKG